MTEKQLVNLGFEKTVVENEWYYYTLKISDIWFTSSTSDESGKSHWYVLVGDGEDGKDIVIRKYNHLKKLIELMSNNIEDRTI